VPLSPVISTVVGVDAIWVISCANPGEPEDTAQDLSARPREDRQ
jgi:hypothetical protein